MTLQAVRVAEDGLPGPVTAMVMRSLRRRKGFLRVDFLTLAGSASHLAELEAGTCGLTSEQSEWILFRTDEHPLAMAISELKKINATGSDRVLLTELSKIYPSGSLRKSGPLRKSGLLRDAKPGRVSKPVRKAAPKSKVDRPRKVRSGGAVGAATKD